MNTIDLKGRIAVITGGARGIGFAAAQKMLASGAAVALWDADSAALEKAASELGKNGKVYSAVVELTDETSIKKATDALIRDAGKIDILVNNAGITRDQLVLRMKRADWDMVLRTNLTSAYLCTQQAMSSMLKQRWGRIINIASIFGQMGQAGQANYAASKAGLIGLTMAIARELGSRNITCNAVAPGFIETAMTSALSDDFKQNAVKLIPLGRLGTPDDVAHSVVFLASENASYITGHVLNVNGGMLMG
jgi:3-oxoacyl-[acyl-carrier protein] reductase